MTTTPAGRTDRLIATYPTFAAGSDPINGQLLSSWSLIDRIEAAARAGYVGVGFGLEDMTHWLPDMGGFSGLRRVLDANGIVERELEVLSDWFTSGDRRAASDVARAQLLAAAGELGARHIKVVGDLAGEYDCPWDRLVSEFAALSDEAGAAGTRICVEAFPGSNVGNVAVGQALVRDAGAPAGGLLVDVWHLMRVGGSPADLAILSAQDVSHVEFSDATAVQQGSIMEDTIMRRRWPGDGDFDLVGFFAALDAIGYDGCYGVEVISDAVRAMSPDQIATESFAAASRYV